MVNENLPVEEIFHIASQISDDEERSKFLDESCAHQPNVRQRVERLLIAHHELGDFLERSPNIVSRASSMNSEDTLDPHNSDQSPLDVVPSEFGDYQLLEKIAQGGMGVVYRAQQVSLNRVVAIKMILAGQFAGPESVKRFEVEARAAGSLDHPGIVPVHEIGCFENQHYFVMSYIDGENLAEKIARGKLDPLDAASMATRISKAMEAAHGQGIVHRDLKPGNVIIDEAGQPRITDFGLAKQVEGNDALTATGLVLGTPSYMPPEQAAGKNIGIAADIYSIGAILYAMLTGSAPFEGSSQLETLFQVIQEEPVPVRELDSSIPRDLEAIVMKCLEKRPADRYRSAEILSDDLQRFLRREPVQARNNFSRRIRKWTIQEPVLAAHLSATVVMILFVLLNFFVFGHRGGGAPENLQIALRHIAILCGWAFAAFILQKAHGRYRWRTAILCVWAAINPIFLTLTIAMNEPPRGTLFSLYFLLIVSVCFFRRISLVIVTSAFSLLGFLIMAINLSPQEKAAPSYFVIFAVNLVLTGTLSGFLAARLKWLSEAKRT